MRLSKFLIYLQENQNNWVSVKITNQNGNISRVQMIWLDDNIIKTREFIHKNIYISYPTLLEAKINEYEIQST